MLLDLDGKTLVQDVRVSDLIPADEAAIILDLFKKIKAGEFPGTIYPESQQNRWEDRPSKFKGTPFTPKDDPELFFDLTDLPLTISGKMRANQGGKETSWSGCGRRCWHST